VSAVGARGALSFGVELAQGTVSVCFVLQTTSPH